MRILLIALLLLGAADAFGQCTKCKSLEEAMVSPEGVVSLIMNPNVSDDTALTVFPAGIRELKHLKVLFLTDNELTEIPAFIGELKDLKELSFAGNNLTALPAELFTLPNLKELILFDNKFTPEYIDWIKKQVQEKMPGTKLLIGEL